MSQENVRRALGVLNTLLGGLLLVVGAVHFAMMDYLERMVSRMALPASASDLAAFFLINHTGSGVFLLQIGFLLTYAGVAGLPRGKRWGKAIALTAGLGVLSLSIALWITVPPMFLTATAFRFAVLSLGLVGLLNSVPLVIFWDKFRES